MKRKLYYLWLYFVEFLGNMKMRIKYFLDKKYYSSLSENETVYNDCADSVKYVLENNKISECEAE